MPQRDIWKNQIYTPQELNKWKYAAGLIKKKIHKSVDEPLFRSKREKRRAERTIFDDMVLDDDQGSRVKREVENDLSFVMFEESSGFFSDSVSQVKQITENSDCLKVLKFY